MNASSVRLVMETSNGEHGETHARDALQDAHARHERDDGVNFPEQLGGREAGRQVGRQGDE